jgi:hypothetical protein
MSQFKFPDNLRPSLGRLIERAQADYSGVSSQDEWPLCAPESELEDAKVVQQALSLLGYEINIQTAFAVWETYSRDLSAGWMDGPDSIEEAIGAIENLCENIATGQDYAGFSEQQ